MADPQLENGYTQLADELLEALCKARLGGREFAVVLAVVRKTYGWNKKADVLSASQISELTNLSPKVIGPILKSLEAKHVLRLEGKRPGAAPRISIQKDHSKWEKRAPKPRKQGGQGCQGGQAGSGNLGQTSPPFRTQTADEPTPLLVPTSPSFETQPPPDGGVTQKRNIQGTRETLWGSLQPMLSRDEAQRWVAVKPLGRTYSIDEVQCWYLQQLAFGQGSQRDLLGSARIDWRSVTPRDVRAAVMWVESQALLELDIEDTRERDSHDEFVAAWGGSTKEAKHG